MNANMLLAEIKLKGYTMNKFLSEIRMPKGTWSKKIRGITEFHRDEIQNIIAVLNLDDDKVIRIFFN